MHRNSEAVSVKKSIILALVLVNVIFLKEAFIYGGGWGLLLMSVIPFLFFTVDKNSFPLSLFQKSKTAERGKSLSHLSQLGTEYNLNFSSQEVLPDCMMGLDGLKRKLLILRGYGYKNFQIYLVDLNLLQSCTVKTYYGTIRVGELKGRRLNSYIERVSLQFEFSNGSQTLEIPFFQEEEGSRDELALLESKAYQWKTILSKMITRPIREVR